MRYLVNERFLSIQFTRHRYYYHIFDFSCAECPDVNAYNCELKNGYDSLILTNGCVSGYAVSTDKKSCLSMCKSVTLYKQLQCACLINLT